jgi:hypothetical protein
VFQKKDQCFLGVVIDLLGSEMRAVTASVLVHFVAKSCERSQLTEPSDLTPTPLVIFCHGPDISVIAHFTCQTANSTAKGSLYKDRD